MADTAAAGMYCSLMEDVKRRLAFVRRFSSGELQVGSEQFAYECVSVQLRKVLELVAFGSLCANKVEYAKVHAGFDRHWKAKALLEAIERIHPDFYPRPMKPPVLQADGTKYVDAVADGYMTQVEFVTLYDKCSEVLHTRNPFASAQATISFVHSVERWVEEIETLLRLHLITLAGRPEVWLVSMHEPSDGRVHAYIANPMTGRGHR